MALFFKILIGVVLLLAAMALMRRYQMRLARFSQANALAREILNGAPDDANRQVLADTLRLWDLLDGQTQEELTRHLAEHPRLKELDLSDANIRDQTYRSLVGISADKSPEK